MAGLRQSFEAAIQNLKTELIAELNRTNVLKKDKVEALLLMFNQKIINVQAQFLTHVASEKSSIKVQFTEPHAKNFNDFGKIAMSGVGMGGTVAALSFITIATTTTEVTSVVAPVGIWATLVAWIAGPTTTTTAVVTNVSLATWLAGILGVSTSVATAILSGGIGVIAAGGIYALFIPVWRRRMRKKMLEDFDARILPMLRDWADDVVNKANMN